MSSSAAGGPTLAVVMLHRPDFVTGGIQAHVEHFKLIAKKNSSRTIDVSPYLASPAVLYPCFGARRFLRGKANAWWFEAANLAMLRLVMRKVSRRGSFDVAYCQDPLSALAAIETRAAYPELRVVLAVHFNDSTADEWVGRRQIEKDSQIYRRMQARDDATISQVNHLIFVSQYMRKRVLDRIPAAKNIPSDVIFNTVGDLDICSEMSARDLISIGTLENRKNHGFLLEVLAAANAMGRIYTLTIIGTGPLRKHLESLARKLGVKNQVTFRGAVPDAKALIRGHRAYVHSSTMENMPIALLEGLAAGLPVFAAAVGGIPEVFADGQEGSFWDLSDPVSAARSIIQILDNPSRYAAMCDAARRRYQSTFSPTIVDEQLLSAVLGTDLL